jgi:hypothetical protein
MSYRTSADYMCGWRAYYAFAPHSLGKSVAWSRGYQAAKMAHIESRRGKA